MPLAKGKIVKMREEILELIVRLTGNVELRENDNFDLIEDDILDSLAFIQLISELEDKFDIEIQPTLIDVDTWRSVDGIVRMVKGLERNSNDSRNNNR